MPTITVTASDDTVEVLQIDLTEVTSEHHIVIDCRKCGKKKEEFK